MAKEDTSNKISIATFGVGSKLDKESSELSDLVKQTSIEVASKFGKRINNKIIDNVTNISLTNLFSFSANGKRKSADDEKTDIEKYREYMENDNGSALSLLSADSGRIMDYNNYRAIVENIPECAKAVETYLANILSPDDYTKLVFDIKYCGKDSKESEDVTTKITDIIKKYKIEDLTSEIIKEVLTIGDSYISILPYDREIGKFLASTDGNILNESANPQMSSMLMETYHLEDTTVENKIEESDVPGFMLTEDASLLEFFKKNQNNFNTFVANTVNDKIKISSITELLRTRAEADSDVIFSKRDINIADLQPDNKKGKKKQTINTLKINGSAIKHLDPDRVVEINVDGVCYGYYYVEPGIDPLDNPYNGADGKAYVASRNPMNPSLQPQSTNNPAESSQDPIAKNLNISDEKLQMLSSILLKALGKKLNKKYISENKQFKDLLYNLLRQRYLIEKGVNITYLLPEEVIHFKGESIFKSIVFVAKIYLAILTNTTVIKMGRGQDTRLIYVSPGADGNHEQAIGRVIKDMKTNEFKMSNLGSIGSILRLAPGAFHDILMPQFNGEKPIDIEVLPGVNTDSNIEFLNSLKKIIIEGTGLPPALTEQDTVEFARQVTAQNADLCRKTIKWQKILTPGFLDLVRTLYKNEYAYTLDSTNNLTDIDLSNIGINFPSPKYLALSNLIETLNAVESKADAITKVYIPDKLDQTDVDKQNAFKQRIMKKELPQIDWADYDALFDEFNDEYSKDKQIKKVKSSKKSQDDNDMYDGQY